MRAAREVIAAALRDTPTYQGKRHAIHPVDDKAAEILTDAALAALRAEGLVIVAAADVEDAMGAATGFLDDHDMEFPDWWQRIATMLDAALAAGGE